MYETIQYEVKGGRAIITLNRPDSLNAFNRDMGKELLSGLKAAGKSGDVRSILLTGAGRAFCAGQDLEEVTEDMDHGQVLREQYNPIIQAMAEMPKPIVAAVNGAAAGAGFSLALAADFRLLSEHASFGCAFIHIGLVPDSGSFYYLPKFLGYAKALEVMMLGERIKAEEALKLGLATKLIPTKDWDTEVAEFTERLAAMPTKALSLIKKNMQKTWAMPLGDVLTEEAYSQRTAGLTADHYEGVAAFLQKRAPVFRGE